MADQQQNQPGGKGQQAAPYALSQYSMQPQQNSGSEDSPYYKSAAPSVSMPKGGGAIKGIDEKFSVNAVNGTAGLSIPLPLTPGRGGFTPALSVSYNSGSGNSEFGLGWGLSLPAIQRKTDRKLPLYDDAQESDIFLLAGAEDLIPVLDVASGQRVILHKNGYTIKRYRPRIEGLFARIEFITRDNDPEGWWRVTTKENITTYYGLSVASRITDPEQAHRIFKWLPDITIDHKGNVQLYEYKAEDTAAVPDVIYEKNRKNGLQAIANTYLKRVYYGNRTPYFIKPGESDVLFPELPDTEWLFEAVLDYGEHGQQSYTEQGPWAFRQDAFSDFHAGFEIRTYRKCHSVLMFHHFEELNAGNPTLVRSLDLQYEADAATAAVETDYIIQARMSAYRLEGSGSYSSRSLPAMKLKYSKLNWNTRITKVTEENFSGATQGLSGPYQWMDFEGEGISGIFTEQGKGWFYKNNLGKGHFAGPKLIAEKPSFAGMGQQLQWQDLDGDGRRQVVDSAVAKGFWELDGQDAFTQYENKWLPFRAFKDRVNIDWNSPFTQMLDLNGDGRADVLLTEDRAWSWWENEGKKGFDFGGNAAVFNDEEKGPVLLLRDAVQSIFLADMNGDGMTDLVRIRNGEVCYWPNMGYGRFGAKVGMQGAPYFDAPELFNPQYLALADISGTGAADLIYTGKNKCTAWINRSGNAFAEGFDINPLPGTDAYSKLAVVDFLGNGTACLVWSSPLPHHAGAPLQYIDLMGGHKPHLLQKYYNGSGKSVWLQYKSSVQYYLEDKLKGIRWATRLPFPVHCVQKVTTYDLVSRSRFAQEYRYRHGYYDHEEREFRGFGYVETIDTDTVSIRGDNEELDGLYQHPVLTKTWYHTGAWIRAQSLTDTFKQEYVHFDGWDDWTQIVSLPDGLNAQELREAYRALKGSALRQEVYAADGSSIAAIPYSVTATAYLVKHIQDLPSDEAGWKACKHASFMNLQEQSVVYSCERDPSDPRIVQELVLETDQYGNVQKSATVAYPRKVIPSSLPDVVKTAQAKMQITAAESLFTNDAIDDNDLAFYRLRIPFQQKSFELNVTAPDGPLYTVPELYALFRDATETDYSNVPVAAGKKRLLSQSRALFYNNEVNNKLLPGTIESLAIPYESYTLAYTPGMLSQYFGARITPIMIDEAGYVDIDSDGRQWLPSGVALYANPGTNFYTPERFRDPWDKYTDIEYWNDYWLLPELVSDAKANLTQVLEYDWRTLQPLRMKDLNDNVSEACYDILGFAVAMAIRGKELPAPQEGDSLSGLDPDSLTDQQLQEAFWSDPEANAAALLQGATWRCVYDLDSLPLGVAMIGREQHHYPLNTDPVKTLLQFTYSDAMGRELMQKLPCEPTITNGYKSWIGTGRTIYNNKGNAVMQYEPYFSDSHLCDTAEQAAMQGVSPKLYYDALGRNYKTSLPDGTYTHNQWTAWEQWLWDNNDTVLNSAWYWERENGDMGPEEQDAAEKAAVHANTPTRVHTDTLGRGFYTIQYLNPLTDVTLSTVEGYEVLDIQGNRMAVVDGRNALLNNPVICLAYRYNMLQAPCRQVSVDTGTQYTFLDVAGQPLCAWDAEDKLTRILYDELRRPLQSITEGSILALYVYGEGESDDKGRNLRGQVFQTFDGAGKQWVKKYDFKGNPLQSNVQLLENPMLTDVDWAGSPVLNAEVFTSSTEYDALNRPVVATDPGGNVNEYFYDKGGVLKTVKLNSITYLQDLHYDAKGQRQAIWYGNNTKTSYTYDVLTFRLKRLLTVKLNTNEILQDLHYWYDPVGNITQVQDEAQQTLFFNNSVVSPTQLFTYDALYRLIEASGRELLGTATFGATDNWNDAAWKTSHKGDGSAVQEYTQKYKYDNVGNLLELRHMAYAGEYTRTYNIDTVSNRLLSTTVGADTYVYTHDVRGNMTEMPQLDIMNWSRSNELDRIEKGTMKGYYQYSGGQRLRKYVDKDSIYEERIYLGSFELYRKFDSAGALTIERQTVHISDDTGRIAMYEQLLYESQPDEEDFADELTRYIYSNHLQSASLELDDQAEIISYEEYHPYGTTSYQAMNALIKATAKRYRYTGKERDEESGLYYHGARYYIPWLCRWSASDPLESEYAGMSPYNYSFNNPIVYNDPSGMSGEKPGLWLESFSASENKRNLTWVNGAQTYEQAIRNFPLSDGFDFTGNIYERIAFNNGEGTVYGLSNGETIEPSNNYYFGPIRNMAKDAAVYTFDAYTEFKVKSIMERNKASGIKVDNFGKVRQSPRMYKDTYTRTLLGKDLFIDQGGASSRGKWTTRLSEWQDPFSNYMTPNATKWSKAKIFGEFLGIFADAYSLGEVAKGGSPLTLLPVPVEIIVNPMVEKIEKAHFEVKLNSSINDVKRWISDRNNNNKNPYYSFYQQLKFVYTSDEQVNILNKGQLNVSNSYFSSPNESTTKATLIQVQGDNFSIIKTYDYKQ
ncbi:MAG: hypothetical protein BGO31_11820 [Bacteroidetes bacterium 43-16]|nr:MAG: hypothetical protein BGO31_11820 [Bacteroidetes bacterium 43-16]